MKKLTFFALAACVTLAGCYSPSPHRIGSNYYIAGDSNCRGYVDRGSYIECYNSSNNYSGNRTPMTDRDMQMYMYEQSRIDAMNQSLMRQRSQPYKSSVTCFEGGGLIRCH